MATINKLIESATETDLKSMLNNEEFSGQLNDLNPQETKELCANLYNQLKEEKLKTLKREQDTLKAQHKSKALLELVRISNSDDPYDEVITRIVRVGYTAVYADRLTLYWLDPQSKSIKCAVCKDFGKSSLELKLGQGISGTVATTGDIMNIQDVYECEYFVSFSLQNINYKFQSNP